MKIWLNKMLLCPDDRSFPLKLRIFEWDTAQEKFDLLLSAYKASYLLNFKDPKKQRDIQIYDLALSDPTQKPSDPSGIHKENQKITVDFDYRNLISIFLQSGSVVIKDYNIVEPVSIADYLEKYEDWIKEFTVIDDLSGVPTAAEILGLIKGSIKADLSQFKKNWEPIDVDKIKVQKEEAICAEVVRKLEPIFQGLLLMNYFLFVMEISEGLLICPECNRWYPIIQTIPRLFPKTMKRTELDLEFKARWESKIPKDVI